MIFHAGIIFTANPGGQKKKTKSLGVFAFYLNPGRLKIHYPSTCKNPSFYELKQASPGIKTLLVA